MKLRFWRKPTKITLNEVHDFVHDITLLRVERDKALEDGKGDEAELLTTNIISANKVLDYLLENVE